MPPWGGPLPVVPVARSPPTRLKSRDAHYLECQSDRSEEPSGRARRQHSEAVRCRARLQGPDLFPPGLVPGPAVPQLPPRLLSAVSFSSGSVQCHELTTGRPGDSPEVLGLRRSPRPRRLTRLRIFRSDGGKAVAVDADTQMG